MYQTPQEQLMHDLINATTELQRQLRAHYKMNVRKDYALMVADAQASKVVAQARARLEYDNTVPF